MSARQIKKIVRGVRDEDGAGVKLMRVLGKQTVDDFDPFLLLDVFDSYNSEDYTKGFPWHPRRGMEVITYQLEGKMEHEDSIGNKSLISDGTCQWMTAGSGIIHQEMPKVSPRMLGVQIWLNLPAKDKMTPPAYTELHKENVITVKEQGAEIKVLSGSYKNNKAGLHGTHVSLDLIDVNLERDTEWKMNVAENDTVFLYIISGSLIICGNGCQSKNAALLSHGDKISLKSGVAGARFLVGSAKPLNEPVAWGGPVVMNTPEELNTAFMELGAHTFIKNKKNTADKSREFPC